MLQRYKMYQEPNKSILIIKSEFASLLSSENYMSKREWTMRTTHKLTDAILYITRYQPKFIMISMDHENKNIKSFIRMLMQSFPDRVIVYAEKPHVLTYHYFNELGSNYNIYPPVSGPAIERTLLAYYKGQLSQGTPEIRIFKGPQWNKISENEHWMYKGKRPVVEKQLISNAKARELLTLVGEELPAPSVDHSAAQTKKSAVPVSAEQSAPTAKKLSAVQEAAELKIKSTEATPEAEPVGKVTTIATEIPSAGDLLAASLDAAIAEAEVTRAAQEERREAHRLLLRPCGRR